MAFSKKTWYNKPTTTTPLNAAGMNDLETRINNAINTVVEKGSNSNGTYIKFQDGTMICYHSITGKYDITGKYESVYYGSVTLPFPATFIDTPITVVSLMQEGAVIWAGIGNISALKKTDIQIRFIAPDSHSQQNLRVQYISIGKWK